MEINDNLKQKIILKAWQDEKFKQALLKDPKNALKNEFNIAFSEKAKVTILEETEDQLYVVIPKMPPLGKNPKGYWKPQKPFVDR